MVRMFVYHVEAMDRPQPESGILSHQFNLMQWRVYKIICNPALIITWACGLAMLYIHGMEWFAANWWMQAKLGLLALLTAYHLYCRGIIEKLEKGKMPFTSFQFRLLNEVPTLFLVAIVLLAVYRNAFNVWYTLAGILVFGLLMFIFAKIYKKRREGG